MNAAVDRKLSGTALGYDDVEIGDWYETGKATITVETIEAFAALTGDRFEIHMSDATARKHGFPARVAHGLLVLSLVDGLKNQAVAIFRAIASLGWTWTFAAPVLAGDSIHARIEVANKRPTQRADRAIVTLRFDVLNQRGETVQSGENQLMIYR